MIGKGDSMKSLSYDEWCELSVDERLFRLVDGLFVGIEENGHLHKFNKTILKELDRKDMQKIKRKKEKEDKVSRYNKLVEFYSNEGNIINERSPFEE